MTTNAIAAANMAAVAVQPSTLIATPLVRSAIMLRLFDTSMSQSLSGIRSGFDIRLAGFEQRRACGEDDEIHLHIAEKLARVDVHPRVLQLLICCAAPLPQVDAPDLNLLLYFLACLPEKQMRRDSRAEDRNERRQERGVERPALDAPQPARPMPVTMPIFAHTNCTAAMSGNVISAVQSVA